MNPKCQTWFCFTDHILIMTGCIVFSGHLPRLVKQKKKGNGSQPVVRVLYIFFSCLDSRSKRHARVIQKVDNVIECTHNMFLVTVIRTIALIIRPSNTGLDFYVIISMHFFNFSPENLVVH